MEPLWIDQVNSGVCKMSKLKQLKLLLKFGESGQISEEMVDKIQDYLDGSKSSSWFEPSDLIIYGFFWGDTSEGIEYWSDYHDQLESNEEKSSEL